MTQRLRLVVLASGALFTGPAWAWGVEGHRAVARVAQVLLRPESARRVQALAHGAALADLSTCADEIVAREHSADFQLGPACASTFDPPLPRTARWHYINLDVALVHPTPAQIRRACRDECVTAQLERWSARLADPRQPEHERAVALALVVHFVADLHQPLHAGQRDYDAGGNRTFVDWPGRPHEKLHAVWDTEIVHGLARSEDALARLIEADARRLEPLPPEALTDALSLWLDESLAAARDVAYRGVRSDGSTTRLGAAYRRAAEPVVRERLSLAAARLASVLDGALR